MSVDSATKAGQGWVRTVLTGVVLLALGATLLLALPGGKGLFRKAARDELPVLVEKPVQPFVLTDQDGKPFDSRALAGKVWVANFIFTRCRETCPAMTGKLLLVEDAVKEVPGLAERVRLVSFSVDPERDRPADLSTYARSYGADGSIWSFLTGEEGAVARLCQESFLLPLGTGPAASEGGAGDASAPPGLIHSDRFVLVDGEGRIRGYYRPISESEDLAGLVDGLRLLASADARVP